MDELLGYNNVICAFSSRNKSSLVGRDNAIQVGSDLGNNHLGNDLVNRVAKTNRPIIP